MRRLLAGLALVAGMTLMGVASAQLVSAHDISDPKGVCTGPNAADFTFTFTNFGSESRFIKIYKGGVLISDAEGLTGDGSHTIHVSNIDTGNGNQANVQFHFESDAVVNGTHDISVDFTLCQPTTTTGATTTGATTTAATTTMATTTTLPCDDEENGRECETTTTGATTTMATTTMATTTTTATTLPTTTTVPVTNPCPGSGCPQDSTTTVATTLPTTTTTVASTTTVAPPTSAEVVTSVVTTEAPPTITAEPEMPVTGSSSGPLIAIGFGLVALGTIGALTSRRKPA